MRHPVLAGAAAAGIAALAGMAIFNEKKRRDAEREHPPLGRFVHLRGVRLHYLDQGSGKPLVLLHGNGSAMQDFATSGLLDDAVEDYRVLAFDRPGFGYSSRPRLRSWTAAAQADLIHDALRRLGVDHYTVLGHSWGASVALEMALKHPESVQAAVLVSGYYFPSARVDAVLSAGPAIPIIGDLLRYTLMPLVGRVTWPVIMRKIFAPGAASKAFSAAVKELALRPSQLRASAAESGLLIPNALEARDHYGEISVPVGIVAGQGDRLIDPEAQSVRLHQAIAQSSLDLVPDAGHMVHHAASERVRAMLDKVKDTSRPKHERSSRESA